MKNILKRFIAYLIDMLIVVTLTQLISNTTLFNPNLNKYQKYSKEYSEITENLLLKPNKLLTFASLTIMNINH